jgi:subtilisin family serine protease
MTRRLFAVLAAFVLIVGQAGTALAAASSSGSQAANSSAAPIDKTLLAQLDKGTSRFIVEFASKADLRAAAKEKTHTKRVTAVYNALTKTAKASQGQALQLLKGMKGVNAKSYWLTNSLVVTGDVKLARKLAALKGVTSVHAQKIYPLVKPVETKIAILAAAGDPEWGVEKIGADQVWAEGITGAGIVVSSIDTGVDFSHPALVENYRGNNHDGTFTHDYNWWDPSSSCPGEPCDNVGHGTHTMGTIAGGDGPGPFTPDTGVAPGATWITAKGCEDFGCTSESLLSSGQFILAPTDLEGNNPDPSLAPDLVSNSWGSDDPNDTFYFETVEAWRAAGIIPVFAAGNAGPGCGSAGTPGNFNEVISLGATDIDDQIADFSSRGPSPTGKTSPNVSAPGVDVISSVPGGGYESFSGTSMATPHAAGTIALMLSAKAGLLGDFNGVLNALDDTAIDRPDDACGTSDPSDNDPNYVYGEGRIDAKAAVDLVKTGGTLSGTVLANVAINTPIPGARVVASNGDREFAVTADGNGDYSIFLAAGTYTVVASAFGYAPQIAAGVIVRTDETTDQDFALTALPRFHVTGHVTASEDGSPIEGASVTALGTPVAPATTNALGAYDLELPIGDYTLRASAGGCTEIGEAQVSLVDSDITQDFSLFRKLDDFGHGCAPIPFDWVDAGNQTGLFGDEFAGRLVLPFDFDFYDGTYHAVFLSDNGYINFLAPDQYNGFPVSIPSTSPPNAAIYPFWQDLFLDDLSSIDYDTIGDSPNRAFVIEYHDVKVFGASARLTFEVKLWEDGRIDFLYGANPANPGDGRNAGIGIENAAGTDALQFSFLEDLLGPNEAYRFEHVPTGLVHGVVTDANDGDPIAGAAVTASPGGRTALTDAAGAYSLRLRPGSYTLTATKEFYLDGSASVIVTDGSGATQDFALDASIAIVEPTTVNETVDFGGQTSADLTLSNPGSGPLFWTAKERDQGVELPPLPTPTATVIHRTTWGPQKLPAGFPRTVIADTTSVTLSTIITDPVDSLDQDELIAVRAGSDGSSVVGMALDFADSTPMNQIGGYVYLDTDQDPSTGLPAEAFFGLPSQDIGMEYFIDIFGTQAPDPYILVVDVNTFEVVAEAPATIDGHSILFDFPIDAIGGDDGFINVAMVTGYFGPSDWAPDEGHGTIQPFGDVPWLSETPESGNVPAGGSQDITLHLGSADLAPGIYHATVVFVTNAPKQQQVPVDVTLTVTLPDEFGAASGTVTNAHTGEPLGGVSILLHATWQGNPLDLPATTAADGTWSIVGPEGTWSTDFTLDGYVPVTQDVTIVRGVTTPGNDVGLHRIQPHATLDGGPFVFVLTPDRQGSGTLTLANPGGHTDLEFQVGERPIATATNAGHVSVVAAGVDSHHKPASHVASRVKPSIVGQPTLVLMDTLPWDSDALLQVLDANGIAHDDAGSADMDTIDLNPYKVVFIANDQSQVFYNAYLDNFGRFDAYVQGGGILWFEAAAFGFQDGNLDGVQIPGGLTIHGPQYEDDNTVVAPDHPIMAGVPNPFSGTSASHTVFSDLPAGATVIAAAASDGQPTLVEYDHGAGHVIALAQTLEFAWANDQDGKLILENGVPYAYAFQTLSDVPWLSVAPTEGTIPVEGSQDLMVTVDSTGLEPGVYRAIVVVLTNDPDNAAFQVPVTLVVPAYQQGIDTGAGTYTDPANGNFYASDRAFSAGSFGYVGASSTRSTGADIAGTTRDPLYQDLRTGMTDYRFSVPNGTYRVDLSFAELQYQKAKARVFGVSLEDSAVLNNFDVYAAAGGRYIALDRSFLVEVTDGVLDISFLAQRGDKPIINGILVTEMPPGSPGL